MCGEGTGARESACTVRSHVCWGGTGARESACPVRCHVHVGELGLGRVPVQ